MQVQDEIRSLNANLKQRVVVRSAQLQAANQAFSYSISVCATHNTSPTKRNGSFIALPKLFPPGMENKNQRAPLVSWRTLVLRRLRESARVIHLTVTKGP